MNNQAKIEQAASVAREPFAWPGGYPRFGVMSDGGCLCPACVRAEYALIVRATRDADRSGWAFECDAVNWEDSSLYCDHCNAQIESAYAEDEVNA